MSGFLRMNSFIPLMLKQQVDPPTAQRGKLYAYWGTWTEQQRLATDYLFLTSLTIQNSVSGSIVLVTDLSGVEIVRGTSTGVDLVLSTPYFGVPQTVKVKIRKSTASPFYQSYETQAVITSVGASLYVSQITDE